MIERLRVLKLIDWIVLGFYFGFSSQLLKYLIESMFTH